jgi:4,5-DOPA dioxygenase extradiol
MSRLPSLFISHGAPTFAIDPGQAGPRLTALGRALPRPKAVLVVSPHWMTPAPRVTTAMRPETIHDFGGFDAALYQLGYPARGHTALARRTVEHLVQAGWSAEADERRGLDHGAWVPLMHLYPDADAPVFQVSLPSRLDARCAWAFGQALAPLASDGVLIVGSGSLTHNLYEFRGGQRRAEPYVAAFAAWVREAVEQGDRTRMMNTLDSAPEALRAHPTPEHFWPLLVAAGAADDGQGLPPGTVIEGGIAHGILAMDSYVFGPAEALHRGEGWGCTTISS